MRRVEMCETETVPVPTVGSAWLPLLRDGRVIMNEQQLPVAANLPARYLGSQDGSNKVKKELCLLAATVLDGSS